MESKLERKRSHEDISHSYLDYAKTLPENCRNTVRKHVNTIYVGSIIRIYDREYGPEGQLATAHLSLDNKVYVTLHDQQVCAFVDLTNKQWVVDHRCVKPGSFVLFARHGTDDIKEEKKKKTVNEIRQKNSKILWNDTLMDYPTQRDRETYNCCLFRLTCNCGSGKKAVLYTCSEKNIENAGKSYYGCPHKYRTSEESCNFFVWKTEIEHCQYITCKCGQLCKKIDISKNGLLPVFKFVCINNRNKYHQGCNVFFDG